MGNFSSKDSHGTTGLHSESFHTPPASPQRDLPGFTPVVPQLLPPAPAPPQPSSAAPVSSPPPVPVLTPAVRKPQPSAPPARPSPPPAGVSPVHAAPGTGQVSPGSNEGPPTSTPRAAAVTPAKSPPSPVELGSSCQDWGERDSGLSRSLLPGLEDGDGPDQEVEKLLEECRETLGIPNSQEGPTHTADILKRLLTEVKSSKDTLQTERGEWLQFQADLQVAVAVADRLRAEAEEELAALRKAQKDTERELSAAQQRQKEADKQLVTLRGELEESARKLAGLTQAQAQTGVQAPCREPEKLNGEPGNGDEGGREREEGHGSAGDGMKDNGGEEAGTDCKGVTKRYLRNVTNEDARPSEPGRTATTERSRSLSRLPTETPAKHNGISQSNTATTAGSTNKNVGQIRGRKNLDWQDIRPSTDTGKREETLNKYNSALTELPPTKSQDGFNLLLRRHGGSKRNSLLRWCQSRTQGYKNIDITNFSSSWVDGLAFCAVYHTYLPSHIPYSTLSPENKRENLNLAFKTGETVGITQSLTAMEMLRAGGPDWQRVLSYVESMYRHFEM